MIILFQHERKPGDLRILIHTRGNTIIFIIRYTVKNDIIERFTNSRYQFMLDTN